MADQSGSIWEERLGAALASYMDAVQENQAVSREQFLAQYPEFATELRAYFANRDELEEITAPLVAGTHTASETPQQVLGDFQIIREIGRGGMGVVYEAEQISLKRKVALKVLPFAAVLEGNQVKRFKNEAQAAASLDHPHIVSVHAVGCERGIHYYAMQYVEGQSLDRIRKDLGAESNEQGISGQGSGIDSEEPGGQLADTAPVAALSTHGTTNPREHFRQVARLGIQAAEALHYAHEMGIVHRDIKPSNLMVDTAGHLWVTDFGLATTQTDAGLTMTGDLLGTLRYMSPEQAAGDRARTDYRTDIYSLGITLYELLTRRLAFADVDRRVLLHRIIEETPRPLRSIEPAIPRDLETIVLKATEKEPYARYHTAAELADDLQRFRDEKPIHARRSSRAERIWRWSKRNRLTAALTMTVAALVTLVAVTAPMIAWYQARLIDETRHQLYAKDVAIAYKSWDDGDVAQVREVLDRYASGSPYEHFRDFPWHYLDGLLQRATAGFVTGERFDISLSTNLLAVARSDQLIHLYDLSSWSQVGTLPCQQQVVHGLRFSPDGRFLAAGGGVPASGKLSVWDIPAGKLLYSIKTDLHEFGNAFVFSPDGSFLVTGGHDHDVEIRESATGELLHDLKGHQDDVSAVAISPDGTVLATGSLDRSLRLWDVQTWTSSEIENAHPGRVLSLAFDPEGQMLVSGGFFKQVTAWDVQAEKSMFSLETDGQIDSICFSPDGRLLAAGGSTGTVYVWSVEKEKIVERYPGDAGHAHVAFLPSGEILCKFHSKLFRRELGPAAGAVRIRTDDPESEEVAIAFSNAGDLMVAGCGQYMADPGEGAVMCWDLRSGQRRILAGHDGSSVMDVAIDPPGDLIVVGGGTRRAGFVKLWNARTGMLEGELPEEEICVCGVAISADGNRLAVASLKRVTVWDSSNSQPRLLWQRKTGQPPFRVAFSPVGDVLAVGCWLEDETSGPTVMTRDARTGEHLASLSSDRAIMDLAFSPDGRLVASIDWHGQVEVYDTHQRRTVLSERAHQFVGYSVAFSPDGRTLGTASSDGKVKFWHVPTMIHVTTLKANGSVAELAFSPMGNPWLWATRTEVSSYGMSIVGGSNCRSIAPSGGATVTGAGSSLATSNGGLVVGNGGTGQLTVSCGGQVSSNDAAVPIAFPCWDARRTPGGNLSHPAQSGVYWEGLAC